MRERCQYEGAEETEKKSEKTNLVVSGADQRARRAPRVLDRLHGLLSCAGAAETGERVGGVKSLRRPPTLAVRPRARSAHADAPASSTACNGSPSTTDDAAVVGE